MDKAYLLGRISRSIAGQMTCLGVVKQTFDKDPDQFMPGTSKFLERLKDAIMAALIQAVSIGDIGDIEVEVDVNGFDPDPLSFTAHNPAADMGFSPKDLEAGLNAAETKALISGIVFEAEDLTSNDILEKVYHFLAPQILKN